MSSSRCLWALLAFWSGNASTSAVDAPLAIKIPNAVSSGDLERIREARQQAQDDHQDERRDFGLDNVGGHTVTFLQDALDDVAPQLRVRLADLAVQADTTAGWGVLRGLDKYEPKSEPIQKSGVLTARCIEYISYTAGESSDISDADSLGWHADGGTLMTTAVLLSSQESFAGGWVEFMNDDGDKALYENITLQAGDFLSWRGWTSHRVNPISSGRREVLVIEWWMGEDVTSSQLPRGADTVAGLKYAITLDPSSSFLALDLGRLICKRRPCRNDEEDREAETAFRQAVTLAPMNARRHNSLAIFLGGLDAFDHFRVACSLEQDWLPCPLLALWKTAVRMLAPESHDTPESTDEMAEDPDDQWKEVQSSILKLAGGSAIAASLWVIICKLEGKSIFSPVSSVF